MRILAFILFLGISASMVATNLAGLWSYHPSLPQSTEDSSRGEPEKPSNATMNSSTGTAPREGSPTITRSGYVIAPRCALWSVEGLELYYSPADPSSICVQPPGSNLVRTGYPSTSSSGRQEEEMPLNCAVAPDSAVYCLVGEWLSADTLKGFYDRGELQTPKEPGAGGDGAREGGLHEAGTPEPTAEPAPSTYSPTAAATPPSDYPETSVGNPDVAPTPAPVQDYYQEEPAYEEDDGSVYWYVYYWY